MARRDRRPPQVLRRCRYLVRQEWRYRVRVAVSRLSQIPLSSKARDPQR
jgi:hypothetical protein